MKRPKIHTHRESSVERRPQFLPIPVFGEVSCGAMLKNNWSGHNQRWIRFSAGPETPPLKTKDLQVMMFYLDRCHR